MKKNNYSNKPYAILVNKFLTIKNKINNRINMKISYLRYNKWVRFSMISKEEIENQKKHVFKYSPKFSFVIPLYNTPIKYLKSLISSIKDQSYSNWEICFSDGNPNSNLDSILNKYIKEDNRIKVVKGTKNLKISDNTNLALSIVEGDYIIFGDHDDMFTPNALFECAKAINDNSDIDLIYSDEDKVGSRGLSFFEPAFKPDFNLDMLRSTNYFCHLVCVKASFQKSVGNLRQDFDGAQDYDFVLRCVEHTNNIKHIPKILYHWRAHNNSTAKKQDSKSYAFDSGMNALKSYYNDLNIPADVLNTNIENNIINGVYHTKYLLDEEPFVSIVVPNKDHIDDLDLCLDSLFKKNNYTNFEIIIVENNSQEESTFKYYEKIKRKYNNLKVYVYDNPGFNYSLINNFGISKANGDYVLLLNNDTELINPDSIYEMVSNCVRKEVGAVGSQLLYPDKTIQHAGVILGMCGVASHCFINSPSHYPGYCCRLIMAQNFNACTAAALMIDKKVFNKVGKFDKDFAVAYNDIDMCLRIRQAGYLITFTPYAKFIHYESKSRGYEDTPEKQERFKNEVALFKEKWDDILFIGDEYFNPNLSLKNTSFIPKSFLREE